MAVNTEITVLVGRDKVKATSKGGGVKEGPLKLDQLRLATMKVFEELLLNDSIQTRRHMEVLGQNLYFTLFDSPVGQLLNDKLLEVKQERLRLQLQFELDVDREIVSLPWEFLYSPDRQDFLATDVNLVLSRYLELGTDRETLTDCQRPLRVLVVISRPTDERTVLAKDVVNAIKGLNVEGEEPTVIVEVADPTLTSIEDALKTHQPHIFHFIGHGKYEPGTKTGYLLLVNPETGTSEPCDDTTLIDRFRGAQSFPRLVFLHMCEGGSSERDATLLQAFSGFAPKLIHAKIPSVVAMQYPIKNEYARDFSLKFYATLAEGRSVDEAVQEGRRKLDLYRRSRLFGTPMLYMHSAGGLVLPPKEPADTDKSTGPSNELTTTAPMETPVQPLQSGITMQPSAPAAPDVLARVINIAFETAKSFPEGADKTKLRQRLIRMKKELSEKSGTDIFNTVFQAWEDESDPKVKDVWVLMMEEMEQI